MTTLLQPTMISVVPTADPGGGFGGNPHFNGDIPVAVAVPIRQTFTNFAFGNRGMTMIMPEDEMEILTDRQRRLFQVYKLSRWIRLFAMAETVFVVIFGCIIAFFFILVPFPLMGYFGSKYWNSRLMYVYVTYLAIEFVTGLISIYFFRNVIVLLVLRAVYVVLNLAVIYLAVRLTSFMLAFEESDFHFLRTNEAIRAFERNQLC